MVIGAAIAGFFIMALLLEAISSSPKDNEILAGKTDRATTGARLRSGKT